MRDIQIRKGWITLSSVPNHAISRNLDGAPESKPWLEVLKEAQMKLDDREVKERSLLRSQLARLHAVVVDRPDPFWRDFKGVVVEGGIRFEEVLSLKCDRSTSSTVLSP